MTWLHAEKAALEVDRQHAIPRLLGKLDHSTNLGDPDIVIEHVDAPEAVEAVRNRADHFRRFGSVRLDGSGLAALATNDVRGLLRGGLIQVDTEHARTLAREQRRRRLSVAPARSRRPGPEDEGRLPRQTPCHISLLPCRIAIATMGRGRRCGPDH